MMLAYVRFHAFRTAPEASSSGGAATLRSLSSPGPSQAQPNLQKAAATMAETQHTLRPAAKSILYTSLKQFSHTAELYKGR